MAPKGRRQNAAAGNKRKEDPNKLHHVPIWKMAGEASLRSWPDENGNAMLSEPQPPHQHLTLEKAREIVNDESSQLIKVPAAGFLDAISGLVAGQEALQCVPSEKPESEEFAKLKLAEARKILCDKDIFKAAEALHLPFEKFENKRSAEKFVKTLLEHFGNRDKAAERLAVFGRVADEAARLYTAAMTAIELTALSTSVKEWAKKIPELEKQSASVRKFSKSQKQDDLVAALASGAAAAAEKTARKKRRAFGGDLESAEKDSSDSGGDSSDGSKSKHRKNKKKKDKKRDRSASRKRSRSRSKDRKDKKKREKSDDSDEKKKDKKKREKSDDSDEKKKDKKKRKRSSSRDEQEEKKKRGRSREEGPSKDVDLFADENGWDELAPAEKSWSTWEEPDIETLKNLIINCDGKPNLDDLKRIARSLPQDVADAAGLKSSCAPLLGLTKMARQATVATFLGKVKKLTGDALAWKDAQKIAAEMEDEENDKPEDGAARADAPPAGGSAASGAGGAAAGGVAAEAAEGEK